MPPLDVTAYVLDRHTRLYDAFFADRRLVRSGRLSEIRLDDLMRDPIGTLRAAYTALELPAFDHVRPRLEQALSQAPGPDRGTGSEPRTELRAPRSTLRYSASGTVPCATRGFS